MKIKVHGAAFDIKSKAPVADSVTDIFLKSIKNSFEQELKKRTTLYEKMFSEK